MHFTHKNVDKSNKNRYNNLYMKRDNKKEVMNALIMVFQFGINMIVPIFLCTLAGVWIGKKTGADWVTVPCFSLERLRGQTIYTAWFKNS